MSTSSRDGPVGSEREPIVPFIDVTPMCGVVCCINSLYFSSPGCLGCSCKVPLIYFFKHVNKSVILCCYESAVCCKVTKEPGFNCILSKFECLTNDIGNCAQFNNQCFCFDCRCSIPDYEERQCILTLCFITV